MTSPHRIRVAWLVVAIGCLLVALPGCGADHDRSAPQSRRFGRADYVRFFRRPASFRAEELAIEDATNRLIERCMARKGHHVRFAPAHLPGVIGWVTPSVRFQRKHGYGFAKVATTPPDERVPTDQKGRDALADKYFGNEDHVVPTSASPMGPGTITVEGCIGEARRTIGGTVRRWDTASTIPADWSHYLGQIIAKDPDYLGTPMHRWARCMDANGYRHRHYRTLDDPYLEAWNAYQADGQPEHPPAWERKLAVTDARCQISTHLDTATKRIQDKHIAALSYADRRHLRYIAAVRASVVANARRILATHPR